ncbi:uncharacterized protein LOC119661381 [Hermetia illucens]|uniref:uncharacterized protein LOC119661381 n=1 Tax=Hermetia illucens TaxID=343691 RepID=UPI0018CC58EC|nr:uncharacterized protein LOC119661381 [Hermetia illucens]
MAPGQAEQGDSASTANVVTEQRHNLEEVLRLIRNFKKDSRTRYNLQYFQHREETLKRAWANCEALHGRVKTVRAQDAVLLAQNMKEYEEVEDAWGECSVVFRQNIAGYLAAESSQRPAIQEAPDAGENVVRLERIKIPSYSGDYTQWAAFHDLFKVVVHDNKNLSGVQKLQYLRASVNGEAEQLIRHLTLTETNYAPAWKLLKKRYNNKRAIGNAYMKGIWSLPTSTPASAIGIKRILDTTEQFRANTESLGADLVDLIMVFILQQKLDNESNSEWQKFIGSSNEIPTLNQFTNFLHQRFTILEAVQLTERKTVKIGAHSAQATGAVCRVCQGDHRIS